MNNVAVTLAVIQILLDLLQVIMAIPLSDHLWNWPLAPVLFR